MDHVLEYKATWGPGLADPWVENVTTQEELEVRKRKAMCLSLYNSNKIGPASQSPKGLSEEEPWKDTRLISCEVDL